MNGRANTTSTWKPPVLFGGIWIATFLVQGRLIHAVAMVLLVLVVVSVAPRLRQWRASRRPLERPSPPPR